MLKPRLVPLAAATLFLSVQRVSAQLTDSLPKADGAACVTDSDCEHLECRRFVDGETYCRGAGMTCSVPDGEGKRAGATILVQGRCYECKSGLGWRLCDGGERTKKRPG